MSEQERSDKHPYEAARAVLKELHKIYLKHHGFSWSVSVIGPNGEDNFAHLGLRQAESAGALRLLASQRLAEQKGTQAYVITAEGVYVCDHNTLDEALPLPGRFLNEPGAIPVEGGFSDEAVVEQLRFLRSDDLRVMLSRDVLELRRALTAGLVKASMLLCGSVLETILCDVIGRRADLAQGYRPKKKFPDGFSLPDLIEVAVEEGLVTASVAGMATCVTDHRDLIHPEAERRRHTRIDPERAGAMAAFLKVIIKDLGESDAEGRIVAYETK